MMMDACTDGFLMHMCMCIEKECDEKVMHCAGEEVFCHTDPHMANEGLWGSWLKKNEKPLQ